jgi:hypothetical protein
MPRQWEDITPHGNTCVFCGMPIGQDEEGRAVWDLDYRRGWQVLAYHYECQTRAVRSRQASDAP